MSALWNWLRWVSLPKRHRRLIEEIGVQDEGIAWMQARIDRRMAEMGMGAEYQRDWWERRGRHLIEGRTPP